jgi:lipid II:glycine glycyltransferase (peptidoglycan interpeptide bridge formation enzyme)
MENEARPLEQGYSYEADGSSEEAWGGLVQSFADGNIYQTWQYAAILGGARNLSHILLKKDGEIVGIAMVRIKTLPVVKAGIAYVYHGPVFKRAGSEVNFEHFRQALRALRNEFVCRRGLTLRAFPAIFEDDDPEFAAILEQEGFSLAVDEAREKTVLMDLTPPLDDLRQGMARNWKRNLKHAESFQFEIIEDADEYMIDEFVRIYAQMVTRKEFNASDTVGIFKRLQASLPEELKLKIRMCKCNGEVSAILATSAIGEKGIDMYAASSNSGIQNKASYLLRWMKIQKLKSMGITQYDLNGVNPVTNPGTYRFKRDLAGKYGREVYYLGKFDASPGGLRAWMVTSANWLRNAARKWGRAAAQKRRERLASTAQSS